jgi:hypothetical protein
MLGNQYPDETVERFTSLSTNNSKYPKKTDTIAVIGEFGCEFDLH